MNLQQKYIFLENGEVKEQPLAHILGKNKTILFFYPKDNTPGCTVENKDFTEHLQTFSRLGYTVVGVSKDSIDSHRKFSEKQCLKHILISDPDLLLHKELGAYGEKNNYGKIVEGVIRSTFVVDNNGVIEKEYRNIRAKGHVARIMKELSAA